MIPGCVCVAGGERAVMAAGHLRSARELFPGGPFFRKERQRRLARCLPPSAFRFRKSGVDAGCGAWRGASNAMSSAFTSVIGSSKSADRVEVAGPGKLGKESEAPPKKGAVEKKAEKKARPAPITKQHAHTTHDAGLPL